MSGFVTKTVEPQYADQSVYYCFNSKNNQDQKPSNKRPVKPTNENPETETKTKQPKKETKQARITKTKKTTTSLKKTKDKKEKNHRKLFHLKTRPGYTATTVACGQAEAVFVIT